MLSMEASVLTTATPQQASQRRIAVGIYSQNPGRRIVIAVIYSIEDHVVFNKVSHAQPRLLGRV